MSAQLHTDVSAVKQLPRTMDFLARIKPCEISKLNYLDIMNHLKHLFSVVKLMLVACALFAASSCSDDENTLLGPIYATASSSTDGTEITVNWNLVTEIPGYDITLYEGTMKEHAETPVATASHTTYERTHTFTDLTPGTQYVVYVTGQITGTQFTSASSWGVNVLTNNL
jgi:hypothetical protein